MQLNYSPGRVITTAFLFLFFIFESTPVIAQSGSPLDASALAKLMEQNQKSGHPPFYRICEQYDISFDNAEAAAKYQQQLITGIKNMEGVIGCTVDPAGNLLHVQFPKETEKVQGPGHIADIKAIMDTYHLRMTACKQATYRL